MKTKNFENAGIEIQTEQIVNLPILHFKKKGEPFTLRLMFDFGSFWEDKIGSAHYLEHLLVSGTEKYDSKKKIADEFEKRGCSFEAWTSYFNLYINELNNSAADVDFAAQMTEQMILHPTFNELAIETERSAILNEIGGVDKDKTRMIRNSTLQSMFPNSRLSLDNKGDANCVKIIGKEDILATYNRLLNSKKVLITGGDFDIAIIKKKIAEFSKKLIFKNLPAPNIKLTSRKGKFAVRHPMNMSGVSVMFERAAYGDKKKTAIRQFLNGILFGKNGLLLEKLRYKNGLTYNTTDVSFSHSAVDFFGVFAETSKGNEEKALFLLEELFFEEIYQHVNKGSVSKYTSTMRLKEKRNYQTTDQFIDKYAISFLDFGKHMVWHDEYLSFINSITIEEIADEIKQMFNRENQSVVIFE